MTRLLFTLRAAVAPLLLLLPLVAPAQGDASLCIPGPKPDIAKFKVHWESFNKATMREQKFVERDYAHTVEGKACVITALRDDRPVTRPCNWNARMACDLKLGKAPVEHRVKVGAGFQAGKLQWVRNETFNVNVKRGEAVSPEARQVAVVKFSGTWVAEGAKGTTTSTIYYDRAWGLMLKAEGVQVKSEGKAEGAPDAEPWGEAITLVEVLAY